MEVYIPFIVPGRSKHSLLTGDERSFSPDLEDLPRLFFGVRGGGNDEEAIQQVDGDTMRALIVCAADTEIKRVGTRLYFQYSEL